MLEGLTRAVSVAKDCAMYYGRGSDQFPGCQAVINSLEGEKRRAEGAVNKDSNSGLAVGKPIEATHALVILLHEHESELGFEDNQVLLFTSQEAAQKWAVDRIVEKLPQWKRDGDRVVYGVPVEVDSYTTDEEALDAYQFGLESMEYFHVVKIGRCDD